MTLACRYFHYVEIIELLTKAVTVENTMLPQQSAIVDIVRMAASLNSFY
jgi:hypothetical protein